MAVQFDPIAKDESLNTTETPSRNIADVLAQGLAAVVGAMPATELANLSDVIISTPSNGQTLKYNSVTKKWENANDAGGHIIENPSGTDMTQRANLQFVDAHLTDDSVNDRTEIENIKSVTEAQFALETEDGFYNVTDESDEELTAYDIAYDVNDSIGEKIDDLDDRIKSIDITTPSTGNTMTLTLPTGFTTSNCIVLNIKRLGTEDHFVQNADTTVYFAGTTAMLYYANNMQSRNMTIYFMRIA